MRQAMLQGLPVTSIGTNAFKEQPTITGVVLPDSITSIGSGAFYSCTRLKSVNIPVAVTKIGASAFERCSLLKTVTFETTEGWMVADNAKGTENPIEVSATDLADVSKAATLLRSAMGYVKQYWMISSAEE